MKKDLKSKLLPSLDEFIDDIAKEYVAVDERQHEVERELKQVKALQEDLKEQKKDNYQTLKLDRDRLEEVRKRQIELNNELKDESSKYSKLANELKNTRTATKELLKDAEAGSRKISDAIEKSKKKEREYQQLIDVLKIDNEKLDKKREEIIHLEKKVNRDKKIYDKDREKLVDRQMECKENELKVSAREVEVERLIRHYKLEKKVKHGNG